MDSEEYKKVLTAGKTKEELYEEYKQEKEARLKAHQDAEEIFRQKVQTVKLETTSGLAEQEDEITTKISLETFERPKATRKQRRASMAATGVSLEILAPLDDYKLELEDVSKVQMPISPIVSTPTLDGGIFTGGTWDGSAVTDPNIMFSAEALAGWVTVSFQDGPLGIQLEPTVGEKACRVTGFMDTLGCPSQARASGKVKFDDVIVKVNGKIPASYEDTLEMIAAGGERTITFRPGFSYEFEDFSAKVDNPKPKKKKAGRTGRRASMGVIPSSHTYSPTDVFSGLEDNQRDKTDYGYGDMGYGNAAPAKEESPKAKKKSSSGRRTRRASCVAAMPDMPGLVSASEVSKSTADKKPAEVLEKETKKKVSKRGRRASMSSMPPGAMPGLVSAMDAAVTLEKTEKINDESSEKKKEKKSKSTKKSDSTDSAEEPPKKAVRKSRRASMSAIPSNEDDVKPKKKSSSSKKSDESKEKKKSKKELQ
jgi:hypothetical protein